MHACGQVTPASRGRANRVRLRRSARARHYGGMSRHRRHLSRARAGRGIRHRPRGLRDACGIARRVGCASRSIRSARCGPHRPRARSSAQGTVMDVGGDAELCLGPVAESYPPQCSGIPVDELVVGRRRGLRDLRRRRPGAPTRSREPTTARSSPSRSRRSCSRSTTRCRFPTRPNGEAGRRRRGRRCSRSRRSCPDPARRRVPVARTPRTAGCGSTSCGTTARGRMPRTTTTGEDVVAHPVGDACRWTAEPGATGRSSARPNLRRFGPDSSALNWGKPAGWNVGGPRHNGGYGSTARLPPRGGRADARRGGRSGLGDGRDPALRADGELLDAMVLAGELDPARRCAADRVRPARSPRRSQSPDRDERLTTRMGCHDVSELVQRLTRLVRRRRLGLQRAAKAVTVGRVDPGRRLAAGSLAGDARGADRR